MQKGDTHKPFHIGTWEVQPGLNRISEEGDNDVAIDYVRKAIDAGWTRAWFGRIDPIMADLRKDARYMQILEELEKKLLAMRERTQVLASNDPDGHQGMQPNNN